jgi:hypothetical protein
MIADADQKSVLLRLHDQLDESQAELSAAEVAKDFRPSIDPLKMEAALKALVTAGLVLSISHSPTRYRISRAGIAEVEKTHDISTTVNPGTGVVHRTYSDRGLQDAKPPKIDWTKWGTIIAAVGLLATVLIAVLN